MFELTTGNLDHELRERKIADGLRRRQLFAGPATTTQPATTRIAATATRRTPKAPSAPVATRATAQR